MMSYTQRESMELILFPTKSILLLVKFPVAEIQTLRFFRVRVDQFRGILYKYIQDPSAVQDCELWSCLMFR